jgi:hypothetical protein
MPKGNARMPDDYTTDSTWTEKDPGSKTEAWEPDTKKKKSDTTNDKPWDESWAEPKT